MTERTEERTSRDPMKPIPVVDIFAGPGGLGEGFSAFDGGQASRRFHICLSIESHPVAHQTLELRSFFRQFDPKDVPEEYYRYLRGELPRSDLFEKYPDEAAQAQKGSWQATLGDVPSATVDYRIRQALNGSKVWVLIGGPPCQAYSLAGRSRSGGIDPEDHRVYLYKEYLRILAVHRPPVFVMENVKGILSSKLKDAFIFDQIRKDLEDPARAAGSAAVGAGTSSGPQYRLYSFVKEADFGQTDHPQLDSYDFVIQCEHYQIPQARHRVIILGIRSDLTVTKPLRLHRKDTVRVSQVLADMPRVRSGLSKVLDSGKTWQEALRQVLTSGLLQDVAEIAGCAVSEEMERAVRQLRIPRFDRGKEFVSFKNRKVKYETSWFLDKRLGGVCNHSTRGHIISDLHRYLFAACYAKVFHESPTLNCFPPGLHPEHKNVQEALKGGCFEDRFRVQVGTRPATTVTSHIAKDGHYYIHPDPRQCRSLTVREAARLQTFPDNYFFEGPRTAQYVQVGNAVPPLLARQIAGTVMDVFSQAEMTG